MLPSSTIQVADLTVIKSEDLELKWEFLEQFQLGGGGFADVYHVFYRGKDAVLKKPKGNYEAEKADLMREALVVASLNNCANVIRLYGVCDESPFCGLIMEYCAGPNLSELVFQLCQNRVQMETLRIFKWCHELTRTLCDLNETHYHGDLTPQNVYIKERPCCCPEAVFENVTVRDTVYALCTKCRGVHLEHISLRLGDFGMSYEHGTPRKYIGTVKFMAPETQLGIYTQKSEVYSFGFLMLTLVIGKPTDQCADEKTRFLHNRNSPQFDLSNCESNSIRETVIWCTHKDPDMRPNFRQLLGRLNEKCDQYASLRGSDSRSKANREREEFLDHYRIPRKITMAHRTTTTSTFLSSETGSNLQIDIDSNFSGGTYYGGPLDNNVFVDDTPFSSPSTSRKNSEGYEKPSKCISNPIYADDEVQLPRRRQRERSTFWRLLVQAKRIIGAKVTSFMRLQS